jgi:hypothetical protein
MDLGARVRIQLASDVHQAKEACNTLVITYVVIAVVAPCPHSTELHLANFVRPANSQIRLARFNAVSVLQASIPQLPEATGAIPVKVCYKVAPLCFRVQFLPRRALVLSGRVTMGKPALSVKNICGAQVGFQVRISLKKLF